MKQNVLQSIVIGAISTVLTAWLPNAEAAATAPQLIIKLRSDATGAKRTEFARSTLATLSELHGTPLQYRRGMFNDADVVRLPQVKTEREAKALAAKIALSPQVEYAELDRWMYPLAAPNDPLFTQQWALSDLPGGIRASAAWDITTGSDKIVVAVLDTGVLPHAAMAGRILPGYDFVSADPDGVPFRGNDGDGRDGDASDPGDWISASDLDRLNRFPAEGDIGSCGTSNSSWHGTRVASLIAANGNDGLDMAGVDWKAKLLPVRVLGKCGERESDVADGVAWAAGLPVPGVPLNPNPAHVINISLGADGPCSKTYNDAFERALRGGTTRAIVVAAGNSRVDFKDSPPANCNNVISVAALGAQGALASYSNFGTLTISAPGGDSPQAGGGLLAASNNGTTTPTTDTIRAGSGTSFAAPMVAGVVSLMLSVNPDLSAAQVRSILTQSARPFPAGTCTFNRCGAGLLDAPNAITLAKATVGEGGGKLAPAAPKHSGTDIWWNEAESGTGLSVTQSAASGQIFAVWYAYADDNRPAWFTISGGTWLSESDFVGDVFRVNGSAPNAAFDAALIKPERVGTAKISFASAGQMTFSFKPFSGATLVKKMSRLPF